MCHLAGLWIYPATKNTSLQTQHTSCSHSFDSFHRVPRSHICSNLNQFKLGDHLEEYHHQSGTWSSTAKASQSLVQQSWPSTKVFNSKLTSICQKCTRQSYSCLWQDSKKDLLRSLPGILHRLRHSGGNLDSDPSSPSYSLHAPKQTTAGQIPCRLQ